MERPFTAPAKTTNKSGVSTEKRREYADNAKRKQAETKTAEEIEYQKWRDAAKAQAYRDRQKAKGLSSRATMSAEALTALRLRNKESSKRYRDKKKGIDVGPTQKQLQLASAPSRAPIVRYIQSVAASAPAPAPSAAPMFAPPVALSSAHAATLARFEVPSFDIIATMDKRIHPGVKNTIEKKHPIYKYSEYAFETKEEEEKGKQLERSAQHSKRPRSHYRMTPSATTEETEKKQRVLEGTQEGGKKTKAKTQKAAKKK